MRMHIGSYTVRCKMFLFARYLVPGGQLSSFIPNMSGDHVTDLKKGILGDAEWRRRWKEGESHWHNNKNIDPYVHHLCLHQYYHLNI